MKKWLHEKKKSTEHWDAMPEHINKVNNAYFHHIRDLKKQETRDYREKLN